MANSTEVVVRHKLNTLIARGHAVRFITSSQVRINERFDIFWQNKRYHDLKENRLGDYYDLISFIESKTHEQES